MSLPPTSAQVFFKMALVRCDLVLTFLKEKNPSNAIPLPSSQLSLAKPSGILTLGSL